MCFFPKYKFDFSKKIGNFQKPLSKWLKSQKHRFSVQSGTKVRQWRSILENKYLWNGGMLSVTFGNGSYPSPTIRGQSCRENSGADWLPQRDITITSLSRELLWHHNFEICSGRCSVNDELLSPTVHQTSSFYFLGSRVRIRVESDWLVQSQAFSSDIVPSGKLSILNDEKVVDNEKIDIKNQ